MELPSYVALSFMAAQTRATDVTAANLANAGTAGFKAERVLFSDWLSPQPGITGPKGHIPGSSPVAFVQDRATYREQAEGTLTHTGNPLDLAIAGEGYFTVDTPRGPRLTRAGRFTPQPDGTLAEASGAALLDTTGQRIRLSAADVTLTVSANGTLESENGPLGRIGVVQPDDPNRMTPEGATALRPDTGTTAVAAPRIVQGAIEDSNVQPILEMTRMMSGLRQFQFAAQFVEAEATRQQSAIDKLTQNKG